MGLFNHASQPWLMSFARRKGKGFVRQQAVLDELLPRYELILPGEGDMLSITSSTHIEIGFGGGEHLVLQAEQHPDVQFIGCEPYLNGVVSLVQELDDKALNNVSVYPDDVRKLFAVLPDASIDKVFMLFPDPWPKKKHHKRRLLNEDTLDMISRVLVSGGILQLATDHRDYGTWMLSHMMKHTDFEWIAKSSRDWKLPPEHWVQTRYEQKARESGNNDILYLAYRKV